MQASHVAQLIPQQAISFPFIFGSLELGKYADLIIVDKNILEIASEDIGTAKVEATYFMGKKVYAV